jgi:sulfonate transport system substrate-binding protein
LNTGKRIATGLLILALAVAGGLSGCAPRPAGGADSGNVVLKIASQKGGTRALMEASGVLSGAPYKIEWSEFPSAQALLEALGAEAVDAGAVGDAPFMFGFASGAKIKAVQAIRADASHATAILVPAGSTIRTVADLKGRRIATGRGSIGHYLLLLALEREHMKASDVTMIYLSPGDAKAALSTGSVDAWSTWGSYIPLALRDGARIVVDSHDLLEGVGFEAATDTAIDAKRGQLDDFLHRLAKAYRWAEGHPDLYAQALARDTGLPPDIALATVRERGLTRVVPIDAALEAQERGVLARFQAAGVIDTAPDVHAALDPSFNDTANP